MAEHYKKACPLCGSDAQYCLADYKKRKQFNCPECSDFQITDTAEKKLESAPAAWRQAIAEKAKTTGADWVLDISAPSGQNKEAGGYQALSCEPVLRVSLPPCR